MNETTTLTMHILKLTCVIGCAYAAGWFTRGALEDAIQRINDWREPARWAVLGALCVAGVLITFP